MTTTPPSDPRPYDTSPTIAFAWGTAAFAGFMLTAIGVMQVLEGIAAVAEDDLFVTGATYYAELDLTTWGWVHLVVGAVAALVGVGLMFGARWGRIAGLFVAFASIVVNFLFVPYYPFWAIVLIGFDALVVWSICRVLDAD